MVGDWRHLSDGGAAARGGSSADACRSGAPSARAAGWRGRGGGGPSNIFRDLVERSLRGEEAQIPPRSMDWVYSKDAALGTVLALRARGLTSRVFNISMGRIYGPQEIIDTLKQVIPGARVRIETPRGTEISVTEMERPTDLSRARAELGYVPKFDMGAAIRDYVGWYRARGL